ncbi:MAG: hypothetical protein WD825_10645 [Gemmatimonadaceae bacterium]
MAAAAAFRPLDAVITGYAFENATTALGVLEKGRKTRGWISTEMLCTLDNFVRAVLFSDRIFYGGVADEARGATMARDAIFSASPQAKSLFDDIGLFQPIGEMKIDGDHARANIAKTIAPVTDADPWLVVIGSWKAKELVIRQELLTLDAYFIEYMIEYGGLARFKPVFPGEHLYLGLRQQRIPSPLATHTIADLAGRRIRMLVRKKMAGINKLVAIGVLPIPELPPIFVARVLHDAARPSFLSRLLGRSAPGPNLVRTLLEIRNSPAMSRFRDWLSECMELMTSKDVSKLEQVKGTYDKLSAFTLTDDITKEEFAKSALAVVGAAPKGDVVGILKEVVSPVMKYLGGFPLVALKGFGGHEGESVQVERFMERTFSDKFSASEMDFISTLLALPDNAGDWKAETGVTFETQATRLDPTAPNLARPCFIRTGAPLHAANAGADFDELWKKAVPLSEYLKKPDRLP